jgi:hypothetical protein
MIRSTSLTLGLLVLACCSASNGRVSAAMTDAPTDLANVASVLVSINSVRIHDDAAGDAGPSGDGGPGADGGIASDDDTAGPGWLELCASNTVETFDLLTLTQGRTAPLCGGAHLSAPAGRISQARLGVVSAELKFTDNTTQVLTVPSGSQSGLKINVDEDLAAGSDLTLTFDFVASDSITLTGNGTYLLKPVIHAVK